MKGKMKKWFGKRQAVTSALVLILAAAIYINWRYSDLSLNDSKTTSSQSLKTGQAEYVSTKDVKIDLSYFENARKERESTYSDAISDFEAIEKDAKASEEDKAKAYQAHIQMVERSEKQTNIESLVKAKGFSDCIVVIGDEEINAVVAAENLSDSEILQIQDVILSIVDVPLDQIKIIPLK